MAVIGQLVSEIDVSLATQGVRKKAVRIDKHGRLFHHVGARKLTVPLIVLCWIALGGR